MRLPLLRRLPGALVGLAALMTAAQAGPAAAQDPAVRFMTLDPGHFHAALIHKEMYDGVAPRIDVYAPLGFDLIEHLGRVSAFNQRAENPTDWRVEVHAGPEFLERMLAERPGNVVVIAGRNARKIDQILASIGAGLHVLADKPWIVRSADLPALEEALSTAERTAVAAYDVMTERHEVTNAVQRELVNDPAIFGEVLPGTAEEPAVYMKSVHHILKTVAGAPLRRPLWWFDPSEQGEALSDVGTHLVDLSMWTLFPEQALNYREDVALLSASAWPTRLSREQFSRVSGLPDFPASLASRVAGDSLACDCNTRLSFTLRGVNVQVEALWAAESDHPDTHYAVYRGQRARVEVRQGEAEGWKPEVYVAANDPARRAAVLAAVRARVEALAERWPGIAIDDRGAEVMIVIPDRHRLGHENHFGEVASRFLEYVATPTALPAWERPNMLTKYFITTRGTELSHEP